MSDQRRAYLLKCVCGFERKHIGRPPKKCPQCGGGPEPSGLNRAARRKLAAQLRRGEVKPYVEPDPEPQDAA